MAKKKKKDGRRKGARVNLVAKQNAANKGLTKKISEALFEGSVIKLGNQKFLKPTTRRGPQHVRFRCIKAWDFVDPAGEKRVSDWGHDQKTHNIRTLYHGTKFHNLGGITNQSLRCGHGGMFGAAIYLTPDLDKALNYAGYGMETFYVLEVKVNLGKVKLCKEYDNTLDKGSIHALGYHSVEGRGQYTLSSYTPVLGHTEFAVYDPRQVCITGIFAYQERVAKHTMFR